MRSAAAIERLLAGSGFLRGLSPDACRRLSGLCRERRAARRETLFLEESRGDTVYLLVDGAVRLHKTGADGSDVVIKTVSSGETFGEVILFERDRYPVTATAITASHLLAFARADIRRLLETATFRDDFIAMLMRKQRYLAERVRYLTACDVEERFFLFLRERYGEANPIHVDLPKKDIAAAIGATPETFSRLLRRLRARGALVWQGRRLTLRNDRSSGRADTP